MSLPDWMQFTVEHAGYSYRVGAALHDDKIRALAMLRAPRLAKREADGWEEVSQAVAFLNVMLGEATAWETLAALSGVGAVASVIGAAQQRLAEFKRVEDGNAA